MSVWLKARNWLVTFILGDDNVVHCEACGHATSWDDSHYSEDCSFCGRCWKEILECIAVCHHELEPYVNEYGEGCSICMKCSGVFEIPYPPTTTSDNTSDAELDDLISRATQTT